MLLSLVGFASSLENAVLQVLESLKGTSHSSKQVFRVHVCTCAPMWPGVVRAVCTCAPVWSAVLRKCVCTVRAMIGYALLTLYKNRGWTVSPASIWTRHSHLCAQLKEAAGDNIHVNR